MRAATSTAFFRCPVIIDAGDRAILLGVRFFGVARGFFDFGGGEATPISPMSSCQSMLWPLAAFSASLATKAAVHAAVLPTITAEWLAVSASSAVDASAVQLSRSAGGSSGTASSPAARRNNHTQQKQQLSTGVQCLLVIGSTLFIA